jgi:serine protease
MSRMRLRAVVVSLVAAVIAGGQGLPASGAALPTATAPVTRLSDFNRDGLTDLVARDLAGALWLYPGNGAGGFKARRQMGHGWNNLSPIITPGDVNGDGNADILARDALGRLWLYPGNGAGGLLARRLIGSGWQNYAFTSAANLNGAGRPDVLARSNSTGILWLYPLSGNAVFGPRTEVTRGLGESTFLGPGDVSGDGRADLMTVDTSTRTRLFRGTGMGRVAAGTPVSIAWGDVKLIVTPGNWDRAAGNDLIARDDLGGLWLHPGNNAGGFGPRRQIGHGWNNMSTIR